MSQPKLCTGCVHYQPAYRVDLYFTTANVPSRCKRSDLVGDRSSVTACVEERRAGLCGPEGKNWEAKS